MAFEDAERQHSIGSIGCYDRRDDNVTQEMCYFPWQMMSSLKIGTTCHSSLYRLSESIQNMANTWRANE